MPYIADGITYKTGEGLNAIFRPGLLGKSQFEDIPCAFVELSLEKIDNALKKNMDEYAGTDGGGRDVFKLPDIYSQIEDSQTEYMPFLLCRNGVPEDLVVEDGRHRIECLYVSWKRKSIWCVIPAEQEGLFQTHYSL